MANPFVHVELHTSDLSGARTFYSTLFGWELQDLPMPEGGTYTMISVGDGTGGGMMASPAPGVPPYWLAYIGVDDIEASTRRAGELASAMIRDDQRVSAAVGGQFRVLDVDDAL